MDALASHLVEAYPDTNRDRRFTIEYEEAVSFRSSVVEPGYFDTMGIRLLKGRDFAAGDRTGAAGAVIVNQTFALRF